MEGLASGMARIQGRLSFREFQLKERLSFKEFQLQGRLSFRKFELQGRLSLRPGWSLGKVEFHRTAEFQARLILSWVSGIDSEVLVFSQSWVFLGITPITLWFSMWGKLFMPIFLKLHFFKLHEVLDMYSLSELHNEKKPTEKQCYTMIHCTLAFIWVIKALTCCILVCSVVIWCGGFLAMQSIKQKSCHFNAKHAHSWQSLPY